MYTCSRPEENSVRPGYVCTVAPIHVNPQQSLFEPHKQRTVCQRDPRCFNLKLTVTVEAEVDVLNQHSKHLWFYRLILIYVTLKFHNLSHQNNRRKAVETLLSAITDGVILFAVKIIIDKKSLSDGRHSYLIPEYFSLMQAAPLSSVLGHSWRPGMRVVSWVQVWSQRYEHHTSALFSSPLYTEPCAAVSHMFMQVYIYIDLQMSQKMKHATSVSQSSSQCFQMSRFVKQKVQLNMIQGRGSVTRPHVSIATRDILSDFLIGQDDLNN